MSTAPMGPAELADKAGQEIGVSSWIEVGQQRIVAMGAVPAPRAGSPESPVGRSEAVAHTAEAGGHALEIQMLRVGAQLLRVGRQAGSRRGATPLLMFNGIGGSIELLEPLARAMPAREVIVFDVPGVGHSPMPRRPYRLRTLARDPVLFRVGGLTIDAARHTASCCARTSTPPTAPSARSAAPDRTSWAAWPTPMRWPARTERLTLRRMTTSP